MGLLSYSGLTTKIRAMHSQLIEENQLRQIVEMTSAAQVVAYLKKQPGYEKLWNDVDESGIRRGALEQLLRQSIYQNFTRIYRFANPEQRRFLDMYFRRYELHVLKLCLRNIFDHRQTELNLSGFERFFEKHSNFDLEKLSACTSMQDLVETLSSTAYGPLLKQLHEQGEDLLVFDYGMALDQFYFSQIWKQRKKVFSGQDLKEITMAYGQKFDLINLTWIYRAKKYYHMDSSTVFALLIPMHYRLTPEDIEHLVLADGERQFAEVLASTYYGRRYEEVRPENLEAAYTELMRSLLRRESHRHPHSVVVMYSYLYHKEHEVKRLTTAIECVRYGVPPQEAMQHVMRS